MKWKFRYYTKKVIWGVFVVIVMSCITLIACSNKLETQDLANTSWKLKAYGDPNNLTTVLSYVRRDITLTFSEDLKEYTGFDGLNYYGGACTIKGRNISIGSTTSNLIGTVDLVFSAQLKTYHDLLQDANSFYIVNNELTINCGNGQVLLFALVTL